MSREINADLISVLEAWASSDDDQTKSTAGVALQHTASDSRSVRIVTDLISLWARSPEADLRWTAASSLWRIARIVQVSTGNLDLVKWAKTKAVRLAGDYDPFVAASATYSLVMIAKIIGFDAVREDLSRIAEQTVGTSKDHKKCRQHVALAIAESARSETEKETATILLYKWIKHDSEAVRWTGAYAVLIDSRYARLDDELLPDLLGANISVVLDVSTWVFNLAAKSSESIGGDGRLLFAGKGMFDDLARRKFNDAIGDYLRSDQSRAELVKAYASAAISDDAHVRKGYETFSQILVRLRSDGGDEYGNLAKLLDLVEIDIEAQKTLKKLLEDELETRDRLTVVQDDMENLKLSFASTVSQRNSFIFLSLIYLLAAVAIWLGLLMAVIPTVPVFLNNLLLLGSVVAFVVYFVLAWKRAESAIGLTHSIAAKGQERGQVKRELDELQQEMEALQQRVVNLA